MKRCANFDPEMAALYGTNEHNFAKMPEAPSYRHKKCARCGTVIKLGAGLRLIGGRALVRELRSQRSQERNLSNQAFKAVAETKMGLLSLTADI